MRQSAGMASNKAVIIRKLDRESVSGYAAPEYVRDGRVELLNSSGKLVLVPLAEVKAVYFVRNIEASEEIVRKSFPSRPRMDGLWLRLHFRDQEILEGVMPNELIQQGSQGFLITPPDTRGNTQRMFVPRSALQAVTVLGVIGSTLARPKKPAEEQPRLFAEAE
jgi:hypothetical protein